MRIYLFLFLMLFAINTYSQNGMTFEEFKDKVSDYFDEALLKDVQKEMPTDNKFVIWGYDVGDFSNDGYYDLAFAVRKFGMNNRKVDVFLFCDVEGYLVKVGQYQKDFFEIPLEIGIVIKDGVCYVTQKKEQFHWYIDGYKFDNGNIILVDKFETEKMNNLTKETYKNFLELKVKEKLLVTKSGEVKQLIEYLTVPSYPRGSIVYKGFANSLEVNRVENVYKGAYDWESKVDLSYKLSSAYDDEYVYFHLDVTDDVLILPSCEDCKGDYATLWFSFTDKKKDTTLIKLSIYLGDFVDEKASFTISSSNDLKSHIKDYFSKVKVVAVELDSGYSIKCKIPTQIFSDDFKKMKELPFTALVYDIDNEFSPEKVSVMASSKFDEHNSKYFGKVVFISKDEWYGSSQNIYSDKILKYIQEYGF